MALTPTRKTIENLSVLLSQNSLETLQVRQNCSAIPGLPHFLDLFGVQMTRYARALAGRMVPSLVCVCSIYFPDEKATGSWADHSLSLMQYDNYPQLLQTAITRIHEDATCTVKVPGTRMAYVRLSNVLDGRDTRDYVARVEPSVTGGEKMARLLWGTLSGSS